MAKIDKAEYQKRLDRITEMFSGMVTQADAVSQHRCPYRNRFDQCTAEFRCKNQRPAEAEDELLICGHDGLLDYRSAWESDPLLIDRAKRRIDKIKRESRERRRNAKRGAADD